MYFFVVQRNGASLRWCNMAGDLAEKNNDNLDIGDERVAASENDANTTAAILFVLSVSCFTRPIIRY